jgi:secernin
MCDSVVVTAPHTADGVTHFAKNSDRPSGECQPFLQFPAALHPRGAEVRCTHIAIPQVAETYRVMGHSPWWVWGFEHGVNEHCVAIGNHTVFSREPVEEEPGLVGMDLVRLGLERGRDARESLEIIAGLIEKHGQGGAALGPGGAGYHNSFLLADPKQAWILETSARHWAARPIARGALTNHLTLDAGWSIGSRDLEAYARAAGWWRSGERLDLAGAYRSPDVPGRISEGRHRRALALLEAGGNEHGLRTLQALLRDHGEDGAAPPLDATPEEERYFTLCMHSDPVGTTTASMIAPLPGRAGMAWPVWISFGSPCTGIFFPVYIDGVLPDVLARGGERFEEESAWWVFHRLWEAASADFARSTPILREGWAPLEEKLERERRAAEHEARRAAVEGDADAASEILSDFMARTVALVLARAEELRSAIEGERSRSS